MELLSCWFIDYLVIIIWWFFFPQWDRSMSFHLWKSWCFTGGDQLFLSKGLLSLFCRFSCFFSVKQCRFIICKLAFDYLQIPEQIACQLLNNYCCLAKKKKKTTYMVLKMIKERTWDYSDVVLFMLNISLSLSLIYLTRLAVKLMEEFKITVTEYYSCWDIVLLFSHCW